MVERRQQSLHLDIVGAALDADGALPACWQAVFNAHRRRDAILEPQPDQTCGCQDDRVVLVRVQLGQARVDVATQEADFQVGTARQQLGLTAQAGGAYDAAGWQRREALETVGYEGIACVFTLADAEQTEASREVHRYVFHGVYGDVGRVFQERGLQLLDEQTLAADFGQGRVEQLVTTAYHGHQGNAQPRMNRFQARLDELGLPQRQSALAGGDTDFASEHETPRRQRNARHDNS